MTDPTSTSLDVANWTAERLREMHNPIVKRTFMEQGLTPHQYLTKEIEALLAQQIDKARLEEAQYISNLDEPADYEQDGKKWTGLAIPRNKVIDRISELQTKGEN